MTVQLEKRKDAERWLAGGEVSVITLVSERTAILGKQNGDGGYEQVAHSYCPQVYDWLKEIVERIGSGWRLNSESKVPLSGATIQEWAFD